VNKLCVTGCIVGLQIPLVRLFYNVGRYDPKRFTTKTGGYRLRDQVQKHQWACGFAFLAV